MPTKRKKRKRTVSLADSELVALDVVHMLQTARYVPSGPWSSVETEPVEAVYDSSAEMLFPRRTIVYQWNTFDDEIEELRIRLVQMDPNRHVHNPKYYREPGVEDWKVVEFSLCIIEKSNKRSGILFQLTNEIFVGYFLARLRPEPSYTGRRRVIGEAI